MLAGVNDPIAFLSRSGTDWMIQVAVARRAQELQVDHRVDELTFLVKNLGTSVGNRVGEIVSKVVVGVLKALR